MKTILISVALLVLVIAGSIALFVYSTALYGSLQESLERVERAVIDEDWEKARQESAKLEQLWAKTDATWTPTMDHRQVDRLDESIARIFRLLEMRNRDILLLEITVARRMAKRIKDTEIPGYRNVF